MNKPKKVKGRYGKIVYCDCLDEKYGLPSLKPQSFDLIYSDIPWGYEYDGTTPSGNNKRMDHPERKNYQDEFRPEWNLEFLENCKRVAKATVIVMGRVMLFWWIRNTQPIELVPLVFDNGTSASKCARFSAYSGLLCYGNLDKKNNREWWKSHKFHRNYYKTYIRNGFLRDEDIDYLHSSPKDFDTWNKIISDLNPANILDPCAGTCPIGEVGEARGIPWLAYEIDSDYMGDAKARIKRGMKHHQDPSLKEPKKLLSW